MKITSSYAVAISTKATIALKNTCAIYREAVAFVIPVLNEHWDDISAIDGKDKAKRQFNYAESLVHTTKLEYDDETKTLYDELCSLSREGDIKVRFHTGL